MPGHLVIRWLARRAKRQNPLRRSYWRAAWRILSSLLGVGVVVPSYLGIRWLERRCQRSKIMATWLASWGGSEQIRRWFFQLQLLALGVKVQVQGCQISQEAALLVANHQSYLDIFVLASIARGTFIAKSEVIGWPLLGYLARLNSSLFIARDDRKQVSQQISAMRARWHAGEQLILFAEGTTSDGARVLPFKSSLFAAVMAEATDVNRDELSAPLLVQSLSLSAVAIEGIPIDDQQRRLYAWFDDSSVISHLWRLASHGLLTVKVIAREPVKVQQFASRKALADYCWLQVAQGVATLNRTSLASVSRTTDHPSPDNSSQGPIVNA